MGDRRNRKEKRDKEYMPNSRGFQEPPRGFQGPSRGFQGPSRGFQGPSRGFQGPSREFQGPSRGIQEPSRGFQGSSRGFSGPPTGFQVPPNRLQRPPDEFQGQHDRFQGLYDESQVPSNSYQSSYNENQGPSYRNQDFRYYERSRNLLGDNFRSGDISNVGPPTGSYRNDFQRKHPTDHSRREPRSNICESTEFQSQRIDSYSNRRRNDCNRDNVRTQFNENKGSTNFSDKYTNPQQNFRTRKDFRSDNINEGDVRAEANNLINNSSKNQAILRSGHSGTDTFDLQIDQPSTQINPNSIKDSTSSHGDDVIVRKITESESQSNLLNFDALSVRDDDKKIASSNKDLQIEPLTQSMQRIKLTKGLCPPCRPDNGGKSGESIQIKVNCWNLDIADRIVLMYDIETLGVFRKTEDKQIEVKMSPTDKRQLLKSVIQRLPNDTVFDGSRIIYKLKPIPDVTKSGIDKEELVTDPTGRDPFTIKYHIKLVQRVSTGDLARCVANPSSTSIDMPQESIRLIDCIFKSINEQKFISTGKGTALFYPEPVKQLHDKLFNIHMGFILSVRPQWKIRVNVDMTCKAFFTPGNLADILYAKYSDDMANPVCWNSMQKDISRLRVEGKFYKTDAGKPYSRRFVIFGLSKSSAAKLIIENLNISVVKYFMEHHNIKLKYPELPCVKVSMAREVYLPMELLDVLPYQIPNAQKSDIASEIVRCAAVKVQDRFKQLDGYVRSLIQSKNALIDHYKISLKSERDIVNARVLPTPLASFGRKEVPISRGKWNIPSFLKVGSDTTLNWAIVSVPPHRSAENNHILLSRSLPQSARNMGLSFIPNPPCLSATPRDLERVLSDLIQKNIDLVVLVLYDNTAYPTIKRLSDIKLGIRTQCVKSQTLKKPNVMPNLLLKINGKLGGVNWRITNYPLRGSIMVFGADVTHPAPTQNDETRKSAAAVLGSITPDLMRYATVVRQQNTSAKNSKSTLEIIEEFESIVSELLQIYHKNNNGFPDKLIFYRDGVSEGQFDTVLVRELAAIQRACSNLRPDYEPAITFIVVQKRHHIRFEPLNPRARNVEPGTIVDTNITHRREFDFYLCSQEGIQGTSKPAHYHILYDDSNWTSDALQNFTYFLCHAYMRCSRSVSYPAPTYYSHLAAYRTRDWLTDIGNPKNLIEKNRFNVHHSQIDGMFFL